MSFVVVSAEKAREIGIKNVGYVMKGRRAAAAKFLEEDTARRNRWYWRIFRLGKILTVADVQEFWMNEPNDWDNRYWMASTRYCAQKALADQLIEAAKIGDPVHIDLDDLDTLSL